MVKALHRAGIEVILDVVYNHTAEGNENGPTLSFRGLDNGMYYRLDPGDASRYYDTTGHRELAERGQPADAAADHGLAALLADRDARGRVPVRPGRHPRPRRARRRASTRCRPSSTWSPRTRWCRAAKLIAEPWDVGQADSYDLGQFPAHWREWNGRYRDCMRDFWRGRDVGVAEFATRFSGSSDLYGAARRRPTASVNLITVHDGFTLRDLVSYDAQAQRGQRRGQPRRHRRQPVLELRRGRPDRRPRRQRAARPAVAGACCPPCCSRSACRCCSAATRSAAPRAATTTPTARTTRSPGSTGRPPTASCAATCSGCSRSAGRTRSSAASAS